MNMKMKSSHPLVKKSRALVLWESKFKHSPVFESLIKYCREDLKIPENGFKNLEEHDVWLKTVDEKAEEDLLRFFRVVLKQVVPADHKDFFGVYFLSRYYLYFNRIAKRYSNNSASPGGISVKKITSKMLSKGLFDHVGVSITIHPDVTIKELREYIQKNATEIRRQQEEVRGNGATKTKRIRSPLNVERDWIVFRMSRLSHTDLKQKFGVTAKYKNALIAKIMKTKFAFDITDDAVKQVIARKRRVEKALSDI